ncbi:MAG: polysulfide reductase NrfD [Proteobacteria bacterium]|nr:polysulfide reductase NrfD [Pseudomonadota bacterium]
MIEKALKGSKTYWTWISVLTGFVLAGFICYIFQLKYGLGITGMGRNVSWGLYIANFTFLVGIAASAIIVILPYYLHDCKAFAGITVLGEFLAVSAVIMAMLFVFVDLGEPARVFNVFLYPSPQSILFWDMIALSVYLILNFIIGRQSLESERKSEAQPQWIKPLIILSIPWAISIHTITAFIYAGLAARPFWLTAILAPRFLASAFASGPALLILICIIVRKRAGFDAGQEAIRKMMQIVTYALIVNIFLFLVELFTVFYGNIPGHVLYFHGILFGLPGQPSLTLWMWFSIILAWTAAFLLVNQKTRGNEHVIIAACIAVIVSVWIEKGIGLIVTGFIPSPLGEISGYLPTLPEILISIGIYGMGFLILTIFFHIAIQVKRENLKEVQYDRRMDT